MSSPKELLQRLASADVSHLDRAVAVLWLLLESGVQEERSASELSKEIAAAGYAQPNPTRLAGQLDKDPRVLRRNRRYRLNLSAVEGAREQFRDYAGPIAAPPSDSVLPLELFFDTRGYIEKVVRQANTAYDHALYDCCSVMLRRLVETLIIELYEKEQREAHIQAADGNYLMLAGLITQLKADTNLSISRNTSRALDDLKRLGDLSAHNRRYNAVQNDIDRVRNSTRVAAEELLVLAGMR